MTILQMIIQLVVFLLGGTIGYLAYQYVRHKHVKIYKEKMETIEDTEKELERNIKQAHQKAEHIVYEAEQRSRKIVDQAQGDLDKKSEKLEQMETRMLQREEKFDQKIEQMDQEKEKLTEKQKELEILMNSEKEKIAKIANLTPEQAKEQMFSIIERDNSDDIVRFIEKFKNIKKEEAQKEALQIITKVLPRIAADNVSEFTVSSVDIPTEDVKGKLIGREGRNVSYFEKLTGVEVLIDDTPLIVKLSSYDNEKRFIAVETLKKLIKDGRINPVYIERTYHEVANDLEGLLIEKGKEALQILNLPLTKPDIMRMIGQFHLRYSYGQNLWIHSIEVAKIAEGIAVEMGEDGLMAKKAGLLHDIGKVIADNGQSHTKVGAEVLRRYEMDPIIINAAESHHYDVPMTHAISWIVTAADGISASRPGARFNTKAIFVEKMTELEKLISSVEGVDKVHIMQAGREIMIFVNPTMIDDLGVSKLIKDIAIRVEDKLDYPGMIRVVAIRETKVIDYLR